MVSLMSQITLYIYNNTKQIYPQFFIMNQTELDNFSITNKSDLDKLSDAYEGNLLNYFYGFTPEESRKFNKLKRQIKRSK